MMRAIINISSTKEKLYQPVAAVADTGHKASESQVHVTYKAGSEGLNRQSSLSSSAASIRAQELTTGNDDHHKSASPPIQDGSILTLPTDIMDSEFLHDDPVVIFKLGNVTTTSSTTTSTTSTTVSSISASTSTSGTAAAAAAAAAGAAAAAAAAAAANNISSTTLRSVHIPPAGPTERSRVPTNSAVIFPSVKNKPGFTNSTFFYDYTTPQNFRVSNNLHITQSINHFAP